MNAYRKDFPFFAAHQDLVYFDNAATTQKPTTVIQALVNYYSNDNASVHRSTYTLAQQATDQYEQVRAKVADFIGAKDAKQILFTKGTTEGLNWIAQGICHQLLQPGDEIVLSVMEHHSNLVVWQRLAKELGLKLKYINLTDQQTLDLADARQKITAKTKVLAVTGVSNVLGSVTPILQLSELIHAVNGILVVDGAQMVPTMPVNVSQLQIDCLAFSGHKLFGPTGIGVLYATSTLLNELPPIEFGGEMVDQVSLTTTSFQPAPYKFEAGTQNVAGVIGLGAAIDYLQTIGMDKIHTEEKMLGQYLAKQLGEVAGVNVYGPIKRDNGIVAFNLDRLHAHDVATFLDANQIYVRAGTHCAQPLVNILGVNATLRASLAFYNSFEECDQLVTAIKAAKEFFDYA
ncbi:cysteine desulfurase [Paucilactobacillus hokkaidonensis JCM 18461]|uniref:Cysteine desulfurase n=2 Tax=Paucilactobacillus hokkaidonensis TaxID=1193095 RepID=A0A0A1GW58_9LACO|nr:SufS family cysteine desulfurase [Paucilactobacillus hokkaidonensis]KRO09316.1 cysteine desulfurase, sufs subfamily [Paucilactobacillus hokkaidonensis]BAP85269.1 cysteine desulfurase [Paucilactobacillus hokkaidonensis JCM 18461]